MASQIALLCQSCESPPQARGPKWEWMYFVSTDAIRQRSTWLATFLDAMLAEQQPMDDVPILDLIELCSSNVLRPPYGRLAWLCTDPTAPPLDLVQVPDMRALWHALLYYNSPSNKPYEKFYTSLTQWCDNITANRVRLHHVALKHWFWKRRPHWLTSTTVGLRYQQAFARLLAGCVLHNGIQKERDACMSYIQDDIPCLQHYTCTILSSLTVKSDLYTMPDSFTHGAMRQDYAECLVRAYNFLFPLATPESPNKRHWSNTIQRYLQIQPLLYVKEPQPWLHGMARCNALAGLEVLAEFHYGLKIAIVDTVLRTWAHHHTRAMWNILADDRELSRYLALTRNASPVLLVPGITENVHETVAAMLLIRKDVTETQLFQRYLDGERRAHAKADNHVVRLMSDGCTRRILFTSCSCTVLATLNVYE